MKMLQAVLGQRATADLLISSHLNTINTCALVKIASVPTTGPYVEVEILSKRSYVDENNVIQYKQLENIDVRLAYMKGFKPTTKVGDYGLLIVCQSAIEPFLSGTPNNSRKYDLLDGFFVPLAYATVPNHTNLEIDSASGEDIAITSGKDVDITVQGKFNVTKGSEELISILADLAATCSQIIVNTTTGVLNPGLITSFQNIKSKIEAFK